MYDTFWAPQNLSYEASQPLPYSKIRLVQASWQPRLVQASHWYFQACIHFGLLGALKLWDESRITEVTEESQQELAEL